MSSLDADIRHLEEDLSAAPIRISSYHDLPFAILRYDPKDEWTLRRKARLLATRLERAGKRVHLISLADLLWQAIDETEGMDVVEELEAARGFEAAQEQITTYLSDPDWRPLPDLLLERMENLDADRDIVFLIRASAMAPAIYHMSRLLDEMQGRTDVATILFYPGSLEGTTGLKFMDLPDLEAMGNYRVKIYG